MAITKSPAEKVLSHALAAITCPPARIQHRRGNGAIHIRAPNVYRPARVTHSGTNLYRKRPGLTPERRLPTGFRTRCALRRESGAATGVPDGIPHEVRPPARKRRRNSDFARNCCENAPSGAKRRRRATSCVLVATSQTDTRRACRTSRRRRPRWCPRRLPAGQGSRRHRR